MTLALVTGADAGIGLEICRQLADRDVEVLLCARTEAAARAAAEALWDEGLDTVHPRVVDVAAGATVQRLRERVEHEYGVLDVLVSDAQGAVRMAGAFASLLRRSTHPRIVNVASSAGALDEATRTLAADLALQGVLVNAAVGDGADTPVWLATLPDGGPTGGFFRDRRPIAL